MFKETTDKVAIAAKKKVGFMNSDLTRFFVLSMLAGVFVGLGVMLVFSIGAPLKAAGSPMVKTIMGASFGVALTLVIFAGSELFTGNNLFMTVGWLSGEVSFKDMIKLYFWCYLGNLVGSIGVAWLFFKTGLIAKAPTSTLILGATAGKMNAPISELFFRGILCNMLVCLAIWMSLRAKDDISKLVLIFWCLFAFIGSGFEHSIANMTILAMGLFIPGHPETITVAGYLRNLIPVTLGNIVGGALLIGAVYFYVSNSSRSISTEQKAQKVA
ncbi:nitrite transporter NirC [Orenia metallireducens]|jgi:nitrite transporter NirC|uniref:Nitrite transporter NirC n=1 Tax=Orenia metallireducens TaxID=1413210 RepID=A0A285IC08_9FIRM|nr:formate/nitrite transporter family protein [Orenia metallireducens]PRX28032.1 nitrite transporter NirC [Orenia metallireducens]SNY45508.1 nitrite transporter NirC [Orenia metallireducens]